MVRSTVITPEHANAILDSVYGKRVQPRRPRDFSHADPNSESNGYSMPRPEGSDDRALMDLLKVCLSHCGIFLPQGTSWDSVRDEFKLECRRKYGQDLASAYRTVLGTTKEGEGSAERAVSDYDRPLQANSEAMATTALSHAGDGNYARAPKRQKLPEHLSPAAIARILGPRR
jgi:hypothetical protein